MAKKQKTFSLPLTIAACLLAFVIGAVAGFAMWTVYKNPKGGDVYVSGDLQIHFMELGNNYTGDSIYIKAGETDILIDAGSPRTAPMRLRNILTDTVRTVRSNMSSRHTLTRIISRALPGAVPRRACSNATNAKRSSILYSRTRPRRSIRIT